VGQEEIKMNYCYDPNVTVLFYCSEIELVAICASTMAPKLRAVHETTGRTQIKHCKVLVVRVWVNSIIIIVINEILHAFATTIDSTVMPVKWQFIPVHAANKFNNV